MKPLVYIETTIPSYYCSSRPGLAKDIARTREWWNRERSAYDCYVSEIVVDELSSGDYPGQAACLELVTDMPLLLVTPEILDIAKTYQAQKLMPVIPAADAIHVAIASYFQMNYLLTWNCKHLANVNKGIHLETLNRQLGLSVPRLVTPDILQLVEDES